MEGVRLDSLAELTGNPHDPFQNLLFAILMPFLMAAELVDKKEPMLMK